ncbi:uncharacterized protein TRIVIDRAFT_66658 [Trichoderma virens Gv29-8]|uniref:Uncharacterized protein n=1 Tax=Hypocrea virens (strain Gv29-8 / FGSC 10586) TaxID=413071 RepID=G9N6J7_HYPVG|nr:uncharacterized protein TRIVIDRAFT_66658 [Trichoderma virens Gv29-8]EHK17757.1 hypothetical protein TRIVIDRAFT_66658 [Trichoderma virens Gv29-8]UKZ53528.1 hypothetical protein TrVGV298_007320 [Trichoderma virens]
MSFTKTYFLCPTSDFIHPPPAGPLCLGSIIRSTSTPQYPLNRARIVAVADAAPPVVETDWKKTISTEKGFGLGVYAQFLQLATGGLPLGPEVNVERSNKRANAFAFDTVTTLAFEPTQEYVQEAIKAPAVQTWLREPRQKFSPVVSLFLVTGLKLVKGARIKYLTSRSTTATGNIGIDVPALGTTFGPKGHWVTTNDDQTEFNRESEFVFAFRVKRLKFGRRLKVEDYNKGAFLAVDGGQEDGESVLVEDVDGSEIKTAKAVPDVTENGNVYCVPA